MNKVQLFNLRVLSFSHKDLCQNQNTVLGRSGQRHPPELTIRHLSITDVL